MSFDSRELFDVHRDEAKNRSIAELVSYLKWAFQPTDFEEVKQILITREDKIKAEFSVEIEKEQSRNRELEYAKRKSEAETEIWKKRFGELESRVLGLEEDTALFRRRVNENEEKGERNEVIGEKGMSKAREFQSEKDNEENGLNCDEKINELGGGGLQDKGSHSINIVPDIKVEENNSVNSDLKYQRPASKRLVSDEVIPNNLMVSSLPNSGRHPSEGIIVISDSEEEMPTRNSCPLTSKSKRNRESHINVSESENNSDNDVDPYNPSNRKRKMIQLQELIDEPRGLPGNYSSAAPASSGGNNIDKPVAPPMQNFVDKFDNSDSEDGSSDSTTDSKDDEDNDKYIKQLLSRFGKN